MAGNQFTVSLLVIDGCPREGMRNPLWVSQGAGGGKKSVRGRKWVLSESSPRPRDQSAPKLLYGIVPFFSKPLPQFNGRTEQRQCCRIFNLSSGPFFPIRVVNERPLLERTFICHSAILSCKWRSAVLAQQRLCRILKKGVFNALLLYIVGHLQPSPLGPRRGGRRGGRR